MYYFCTLFDINYLTRGIAMYESLMRHCNNFHLYIFPFDSKCYKILQSLNLANVTLVSLDEFEDEELLSVKKSRTIGEYCWTSTSSTILYCIEKYNLDHCTYIDADLFFFESPAILLNEVEDNSILITDHRYSPQYNREYDCGKYCVQFIFFRNDENGLKALRWWRNSCLAWCFNRHEDGKFGDQKYLDDWLDRFKGVVELQHLGGGVAPWNIQQYSILKGGNDFLIREIESEKEFPLVFYHFHELTMIPDLNLFQICSYEIASDIKFNLYLPYIVHLMRIEHNLETQFRNLMPRIYNNKSSLEKLKLIVKYITKRDINLIHIA